MSVTPLAAKQVPSVEEKRRRLAELLQRKAARAPRFPLSFAQQRLWFLHQLDPESPLYNMFSAFRLRGPLDPGALGRALAEIVRRHEALRTVFAVEEGEPVQVVEPPGSWELQSEDLAGLGEAEREARVRRRVRAEALRPFDLAAGPLFRAGLLCCGPEEHLLFLSMHHVVSDGWSMEVLHRELDALYAAFLRGTAQPASPLPEPPIQYADFALWQRERLRGAVLERQLAYWRAQLAGAPPVLELPSDRPRPAAQGFGGSLVPFALDPAPTQELHRLARREGCTLFMALLAAFKVLLSRYAGTADVVVGTPIAGRTRRETEGLIGLFTNTLALRTDLSGDPTFPELMGRVRETVLGAHAHQELPFEKLVDELRVERSLGHNPVFQVLLSMEGLPRPVELGDVRALPLPAETGTSKFDLSLVLQEEASALRGVLEFSTELFEAATAERMRGHLRTLLEGIAAEPGRRTSELPLLDAAERSRVLEAWNATGADYPALCVHELVSAQAARTPDAVAVVFAGETLSYAELEARSDRLARDLRGLGVGLETRVGVCAERSAELPVALLGVLKAGGAYVPLDPSYPAERLAYMLEDSGVPVLLTQERLRERIPASAARVVLLDADTAPPVGASAEPPVTKVDPDGLAYVIYTSGSTGRPKGAMNAHRGIVNRLLWMQEAYGLGVDDVVLQKTPFSFDVSVWEFFWPLTTGARLVLAEPQGHRDPAYLSELIEREGVTTLHFVPPMLAAFLEAGEPARCGSLRRVVCSGEALPYELTERFREALPGAELHNLYGPTEAAVDVTYWACEPRERRVVPIGRPVANTRLYVLDGAGGPAPTGAAGELYLGGVQVGRGYLGRPELTAEKFVPDPFSGEGGARLYRTGDRARWTPAGEVEFLGRMDQQVKIRGFRIEPGEVEAQLAAHPSVREAVVLVREDVPGEKRLVGYVVPAGESVPAVELRAHLQTRLPEYMVPSAVVVLDAFPLSPNGKVDRGALPAPDGSGAEHVAPRTPTEEVLAGIWADVLRRDGVGVTEDFFELGGHSLLATQVVARAQTALGVELPLRALFEAPTVERLAQRADALLREGRGVAAEPIVRVPRDGRTALPLSFAQQRLWFIDRLEPGSATYNIPFPLRLRGALDTRALRRALTEVVRRHEALRTVFTAAGGEPVQVVLPPAPFPVPVVDLGALPEAAREAEVRRLVVEDGARPFDLARGPLLRAALLQGGEGRAVLLGNVHHVASDGWSMAVLFRELSALYPALAAGGPSPLPEPPVQYADYAVWQRRRLSGETLEVQLRYWRDRLAGAPPLLELPTDAPRAQVQGRHGAVREIALSAETTRALRIVARRESATPFMALLAAWQALLGRYARQEDVVVGTPIAGRTRAEVEGLIGFFANTLVLRTDLSGAPDFRGLLGRVREGVLAAFAHQELPFERLVEELAPQRSLSHAPLFQVMFSLQPRDDAEPRLGEVAVEPLARGGEAAKFDLSLHLEDAGDRCVGALVYRSELFEAATVERMAGHFLALLDAVVADPRRRPGEVEVLCASERRQLLEEWNQVEGTYAAERTLHGLFSEQAARTPGAVAVAFEGESLSYGELERRSNQVAHRLRRLGVGPEARVGLCVERSPELLVGVLGILKAGGAYVPLDPAYPAERLSYMLADSGAATLVTQERLLPALPRHAAGTLCLDRDRAEIERESAQAPAEAAAPGCLAYVIYTSGSTGLPKGVMVTHANVVRLFRATDAWFGFGADDVWTLFHSCAFDFSVWEIWGALLHGGRLVVVPYLTSRSPEAFHELLRREGVTVLNQTPSAFRQLAAADAATPGADRGGLALRWVVFGGEALELESLRPWMDRHGDRRPRLVNMYGITETTVHVTYRPITRADVEAGRGSVIGRAIPDLRIYLLDAHRRPVPVGVAGELYVGGAGVARGYLGREELTGERFVADPFRAGERVYRSGDLARYRADGELEYLGRADQQVKLRGFRIEPGEIEAVLGRHPAVREAVAVVREDAPGGRGIVAYVAGQGVSAAELRAHVSAHLPEHMVPSAIVVLERFPLTPNGKTDRRALPVPGPDATGRAGEHLGPRDETELALVRIWEEVLGVAPVGVRDDFFALGGHSLLAVRLLAQVERATGARLPLALLFTAPTVERLAAELRRGPAAGERSPLVPIRPEGSRTPLFLVHPVGGNVLAYAALARRLDPRQPVYGLRSRGLVDGEEPAASVEEMAADYLRAVRAVQPAGPYRIGGWSMGGAVAWEMARRLEAAGERVETLALIDAYLPALYDGAVPEDERVRVRTFAADLGLPPDAVELPGEEDDGSYLHRVLRSAHAAGLLPADVDAGRIERLYAVFEANLAALHAYPARPYGGAVLLLRAAERDPAETETAGWERIAGGGVEVRVVPGSHFTLLREPHTAALAALLEERLDADLSPTEETGCR